MSHERDIDDRAQHHPVDGKGCRRHPRHDGDTRPGANDLGGDGEFVDAVIDPRGLADHGSQLREHAREREAVVCRDPPLVPQLLEADARRRGEGVFRVEGDIEGLDEKRRDDQALPRPLRIVGQAVRNDEVIVGGESGECFLRDVGVGEGNPGSRAQFGEKGTEQREPGAVKSGHADRSLVASEEQPEGIPSVGERHLHPGGGNRECFPRLREHQPSPAFDGQRNGDAGLQRRDLLRHGGGADTHGGGDRRDTAAVAELAQQAKASWIHKVLLKRRSRDRPLLFRVGCLETNTMAFRARPFPLVDLLLLGVAAVWGASFLAAKDLAAETGVPAAVALRFLVAAVATALLCLARRETLPRGRGLLIAIVLGCSQAAIIGLETWGVHLTSATNAGLLISLAVVMTPVLEGIASRSWLPRSYFIAAVAAVVGVALLVSEGGLREPTIGDGLVVAAAVVRAFHVTASAHLTRGRTEGSLGVVLVQMIVCAAVFTVLAGRDLSSAVAQLDASGWANVLFLGLLCSVFAFVVQLWAVRRTSASRASILMGTEPVWALLVGVLIAGEVIGVLGACGAVLIIAASYAGQAIERRHRQQAARDAALPGHRSEPGVSAVAAQRKRSTRADPLDDRTTSRKST